MATFVTFQGDRGDQVLVNTDHVVMAVGHGDVSTLMLANGEAIPVRGTLDDVERRLSGRFQTIADPPRQA